MGHGVQIFVVYGGEIAQLYAAIFGLSIAFAAIDRNIVTAFHQPNGKLFSERLKATVVSRYTARA